MEHRCSRNPDNKLVDIQKHSSIPELIKLKKMNFEGIIVGFATFMIIGIFHPIVIKAEYHIGKKCWWAFLLAGIVFGALSLFLQNQTLSTIMGVVAFSCLWSIHELFEQENRVKKGWFPANPKKKENNTL